MSKKHKGITVLTNARIIDAASKYDEVGSVVIENGLIADFGKVKTPEGAEIIDCGGKILTAGLVDINVNACEPGFEKKENFTSVGKAAVAGGVTTIAVMPNTKPVVDNIPTYEFAERRASQKAVCNVKAFASITKNCEGADLTEIGTLAEAGIAGICDGTNSVMNSSVMKNAMVYAAEFGVLVAHHAEDKNLSANAAMNEGAVSAELGLRGSPNIAEAIIIERDLKIQELVQKDYPKARLHITHVSTREGIEAIKLAKQKGLNVTCEVTPHHFTLTDEAVGEYRTFAKTKPPLRAEIDRKAIENAVASGVVDVIASSHSPHDEEAKRVPFADAEFGIVGLETLLPLSLALYHKKLISLNDLLAKLTYKPADIIGAKAGRIKKGAKADLTLIDLDKEWKIDPDKFASKSKNSPFEDCKVKGKVIKTFVAGNLAYQG